MQHKFSEWIVSQNLSDFCFPMRYLMVRVRLISPPHPTLGPMETKGFRPPQWSNDDPTPLSGPRGDPEEIGPILFSHGVEKVHPHFYLQIGVMDETWTVLPTSTPRVMMDLHYS